MKTHLKTLNRMVVHLQNNGPEGWDNELNDDVMWHQKQSRHWRAMSRLHQQQNVSTQSDDFKTNLLTDVGILGRDLWRWGVNPW